MDHTTKKIGRNVLVVNFSEPKAGDECWVMLSADRHHDNPHCRRDIEKRHLDKAVERQAFIIDCGDLFCAMQGKFDPRSAMDDIRKEDVRTDYLDRIVTHAAQDYAPYAKNILLLGHGNHETNILKRHGVDLTSNLVHRLNAEHGGQVHTGFYGGWVQFVFNKRGLINLKYHHGAGGGGPVTKGTIQTNRQAVYLPDADIVVNGHTHDGWVLPLARERLSIRGVVQRDLLWFARTPGYKDEYADGSSGFHNEQWRPPKPLGCVWVHLWYNGGSHAMNIELIPEME